MAGITMGGLLLASTASTAIGVGSNAIMANNSGQSGPSGPQPWQQWASIVMGLLNSAQQAKSWKEYETKTDQLIAEMVRVSQERASQGLATYDAGTEDLEGQLRDLRDRVMASTGKFPGQLEQSRKGFLADVSGRGRTSATGFGAGMTDLLGRMRSEGNDLDAEYLGYENKALGELAGASTQAEADINRAFDENAGIVGQDLLSRGLASSTEAAKEYGGNTERRSAELRRLNESLARERIGVLETFGGARLGAKERGSERRAGYQYGAAGQAFTADQNLNTSLAAYDAAMRGDIQRARELLVSQDQTTSGNLINWLGSDATNRTNLYMQGSGDVLSTLGGINYVPGPGNALNFQLGQNFAPYPQSASAWPSMVAGAAPGMGNALGYAAYAAMNRPPVQPFQYVPPNYTSPSNAGQGWPLGYVPNDPYGNQLQYPGGMGPPSY